MSSISNTTVHTISTVSIRMLMVVFLCLLGLVLFGVSSQAAPPAPAASSDLPAVLSTATPPSLPTNTPTPGIPTTPPSLPTNTPTPQPPIPPAVINGGFELGTSPWGQSRYSLVISSKLPHSGSFGAVLGGYNLANDSVYQTITIDPNCVNNCFLKYWRYITTKELTPFAYDHFYVRLYNTNNNLLATLRSWSNLDATNTWQIDVLNAAPYAGQTVRLAFEATTDASLPTSFAIDDVALP